MRKPLLALFVIAIFSTTALAQTTYSYNFINNLKESSGTGPDLIPMCAGSFTTEPFPALGHFRYVYHFGFGCGLIFNDSISNFLSSGSYTIEMYVRLDTVSGYKKLVDYKDTTSDNGFYNQTGRTHLYPHNGSDSAYIQDSVYEYIALARDGSTKALFSYVNNHYLRSDTDTASYYVYDAHKKLIFFHDDDNTHSEQTSGTVVIIHISNYAMDSNTIKSHYTNLPSTLNIPGASVNNSGVQIFPNPVIDHMYVTTTEKYTYTICDIAGKILLNGVLQQGDNKIYMGQLSPGMYLLKLMDKNGASTVYKTMKE